MKKTYISPEIQVVKIESQLMTPASPLRVNGTTDNVNDLLGRGDAGWDDDWND